MENLLIFALIGFLAGTAARLLYPGRQFLQTVGTLALGVIGAMAGGTISWNFWPQTDSEFRSHNLLLALLGAMLVIVFFAGVAYARSISGARSARR